MVHAIFSYHGKLPSYCGKIYLSSLMYSSKTDVLPLDIRNLLHGFDFYYLSFQALECLIESHMLTSEEGELYLKLFVVLYLIV